MFYVSSACETCVDAIAALTDAQAQLGAAARAIVIVTDADPGAMRQTLIERDIATDIYWDQPRLLDIEHNVRTTRTYFIIDSRMILRAMGTTGFDTTEYIELIRSN